MLRLILLCSALASLGAQAATDLRLGNLGKWKFEVLKSPSPFMPDVEAKLYLEAEPGSFTPTIYIEKLPLVANPQTLDEWNNLIFHKRMPGPIISRPEVLHRVQNQYRYVVEFQSNQKSLAPLNTAIMAVALNDEVYVFTFSNHRLTFHDAMPEIRELFRKMQISLAPQARR